MADLRLAKLLLSLLLLQACLLSMTSARSLLTDVLDSTKMLVKAHASHEHQDVDGINIPIRKLATFHIDYEDPQPNVSHNLKGKGPSIDGNINP